MDAKEISEWYRGLARKSNEAQRAKETKAERRARYQALGRKGGSAGKGKPKQRQKVSTDLAG